MRFDMFESGASDTPPSVPENPSYGYPSNGNPDTGEQPTVPGAYFFYALAEELKNMVLAAGVEPDASKTNQVAEALQEFQLFADDYLKLSGGTMAGQLSLYGDADLHNSVWRGKYLGTSITSAQSSSIIAGTFDDLYIGDYWIIGGIYYRIAAIDYYYNTGDTPCFTHHVVVVPDTQLCTAQMNASDTTEGAYVGSEMYKSNLATAQSIITSAFGSAHLLTIRQFFENAVANECVSSATWCDATIWLMSEVNVYGCRFFGSAVNGTILPHIYQIDNRQYPLFALGKVINRSRQVFWLRDVSNRDTFATVGGKGHTTTYPASSAIGVRPAFCVI